MHRCRKSEQSLLDGLEWLDRQRDTKRRGLAQQQIDVRLGERGAWQQQQRDAKEKYSVHLKLSFKGKGEVNPQVIIGKRTG